MPIRPPEYDRVVNALVPVLKELPGKLITIDGRDGSGKTTLGRFLAWYFNVTLVETDLFILDESGPTYRLKEINRIITARLAEPRPVIVEGVTVMHLLAQLGRNPDFLIYVRNSEFTGSETLSGMLNCYEETHAPEKRANLILELAH